MNKRLFCIILSIFMIMGMAVASLAADLPDAPREVYVLDDAGVLSYSTESYVIERGNALFAVSGAQIVIVTVKEAGYSDMEVFAYDLFNKWGIGSKELNNGVLLAMEPSSGRIWCTVGAGLERELSSGILTRILETKVYPDYDAGNCDSAVLAFFDDIYSRLESYYGVDADSWDGRTYKYSSGGSAAAAEAASGVLKIIGYIIIFIVIYRIISSMKRGGGGGFFPLIFFGGPRYSGGYHHSPRYHGGGFSGGGSRGGGFGGGGSRGGGAGRR